MTRLPKIALSASTSILLTTALLAATSCGKNGGTTTANVQFGTYTAATRLWNSMLAFSGSMFEPSALASTSNIYLCVKRVRFKSPNETESSDLTADPDNDDLSKDNRVGQQGWVAVSLSGTFGTINVPRPKVAERFRLDIDNHCVGHPAVQFVTANGSFSSNSGFTMEFRVAGNDVDLTAPQATISLGWQPINNALNALAPGASDSAIISALSTHGTMQ